MAEGRSQSHTLRRRQLTCLSLLYGRKRTVNSTHGDDEQYLHYHANVSTRKEQIWVRFSYSTVELRLFPFKIVIFNSIFSVCSINVWSKWMMSKRSTTFCPRTPFQFTFKCCVRTTLFKKLLKSSSARLQPLSLPALPCPALIRPLPLAESICFSSLFPVRAGDVISLPFPSRPFFEEVGHKKGSFAKICETQDPFRV